ncbi:MAG: RNA polymerase subunit sigma-24 [Verrucomicrobia bacterium]|nr:MAG: RNA polymerase subunit sigma-24 [Verrucomicrobiota bacterium]
MAVSGEPSSFRYELGKLVASTELKPWIGTILPPVPTNMIEPTQDVRSFSAATDEALMGAITDRDENALEALYQRHGETLRSIIESVIHEQAEAEDVLQETLLQIWKQAQNYAPRVGKPLGWLTTITRRRAIDRLRRRQAYIRVKDRYQEQINELPGGASTTVDGEEKMERADLRCYLREQMSALPEFQRQALELSFFRGMSHREIAASTKNPLGTVKTRLELGLQKLHAWLKPVQHKI